MLPVVELYAAFNKAQGQNLLDELTRLYQTLPDTTCDGCGTCCKLASPAGFFIEYLNMYKYVRDNLKADWPDLLARVTEYYYLEMVDPDQQCPFLGLDKRCQIYPVRPLSCRVFGLLSQADYEAGNQGSLLKELAEKYKQEHGLDIPDEIANSELKWCGQVQLPGGKYIRKSVIGELAGKIALLDTNFFQEEFVQNDGTMMAYPDHLAITVLGSGARARKLRVMKEFADHGTKELLTGIVNRARQFTF